MDSHVLVLIFRIILSIIFLSAGGAKLAQTDEWSESLSHFGLPRSLSGVAEFAVPGIELAVGAGMLLPPWEWSGYLALCLLSLFTVGIVRNVLEGRRVACRCFGSFWKIEAAAAMIGRNLILLATASLALWL